MAYERLNLEDGQVLTADHVKHLEDGIESAGGGSVEWENVENRPFGEEVFSSVMDFEVEPEDHFDAAGYTWWKVSDLAPTTEQLLKADIAVGSKDADGNYVFQTHWTPAAEEILTETDSVTGVQSASYGIGLLVAREAGAQTADFMGNSLSFTVPSVGTYFGYAQGESVPAEYAVGISYDGIKPLDAKFLPMDDIRAVVNEVISEALEVGEY